MAREGVARQGISDSDCSENALAGAPPDRRVAKAVDKSLMFLQRFRR